MSYNNKQLIAGVDEVGRGAWAGPMVAAAVIFKQQPDFELRDSKKYSFQQRDKLAQQIKERSYWALGVVSNVEIDEFGLQPANILAAQRAINNLPVRPHKVELDMLRGFEYDLDFELIIDGDDTVTHIQAASIVAKDSRDKMMLELHRHHKVYSFDKHKGYGTKLHQQALSKFGVSELHRKSFRPIKKLLP